MTGGGPIVLDLVSPIVVYVILWWLVVFILLPIGVKTHEEIGEKPQVGTADSAPVNPGLKWKLWTATAVAAVLLGIFYLIKHYELISLR